MAESSRDRLIAIAGDLFYEHGFHAIGLDRILADVGVTKTTFYNHFESKDDLIMTVLRHRDEHEMAEWFSLIRRRAGDDARAQLLAMFDLLADWFNDEKFRGCMFIKAAAEFPSPTDPIHQTAALHSENMLREIEKLARRASAADPQGLARQLLVTLSGAIVARHAALSRDAATTAKAAAELLIEAGCPPVAAAG